MPTCHSHGVTSLTSEKYAGHVLVAGFSDGKVCVFDKRVQTGHRFVDVVQIHSSLVHVIQDHTTRILKAHLQQASEQELFIASAQGHVSIWDVRQLRQPPRTLMNPDMTAFDVHDHTRLFAW